MTHREKEALLNYMDFQMLTYVESFEKHVDGDVARQMYDNAYQVLNDIENTLDTLIGLQGGKISINEG